MSILASEIASQPDTVGRFFDKQLEPARKLISGLPNFSYVMLAARGSSDHTGLYAQYLWGILGGLPVALAAPSVTTLYKKSLRLDDALVVGISQSGQSPDIVAVVEEGRRQGRPTISVTNDPSSPLAKAADHVIALDAPERSIAATKTYTSQLAAMALLGAVWSRDLKKLDELKALPQAMEKTLVGATEPAERAAQQVKDAAMFTALARGLNLGTAYEAALKLRELARLPTQGYSAADFRHGPIAVLTQGLPLLMIMPSGDTFEDMADLERQLAAGGARLFAVSDDARVAANAAVHLPMATVSEWLSPLVSVLPVQKLAVAIAYARGFDPDQPRGLPQKVVRTL
jgi:glucosamine--fructose-6-phosphate aminotransferase (isomerizing)